MPSAAAYTNRVRFAASVKNTKAQMPGNVGNLAQTTAAGCGLSVDYLPKTYVENVRCTCAVKYAVERFLYITTIAGTGTFGYTIDGIPAITAGLTIPSRVFVDSYNNVYIADTNSQRIRKVDASSKIITTIAGNGALGYTGDGGDATSATLYSPYGVCVDSAGNVYIADTSNNCIRKVDASSGIITTIAGTGAGGYNGDGILANTATITSPSGVWVDSAGNVYIADTGNHRIRKVDASSEIITTIAGTDVGGYNADDILATAAKLGSPSDVCVDSAGNVYIADMFNNRIRKVDASSRIITTIAGTGVGGYNRDGILATTAKLSYPYGVSVDSIGNVFIADSGNKRIRKIDASSKIITTIAGTGTAGYNGDGILANTARLETPYGVSVDSAGNVYIADTFNNRIRKLYYA